jgi:hypothetical protein
VGEGRLLVTSVEALLLAVDQPEIVRLAPVATVIMAEDGSRSMPAVALCVVTGDGNPGEALVAFRPEQAEYLARELLQVIQRARGGGARG